LRFAVFSDDGDPFIERVADRLALVTVRIIVVVAEEITQAHIALVGKVVHQYFEVAIEAVRLEVMEEPVDVFIVPRT